jgi:hypothetical protein
MVRGVGFAHQFTGTQVLVKRGFWRSTWTLHVEVRVFGSFGEFGIARRSAPFG